MKHVTKQFSLIDFLGIALPGAILALTVNYYVWDLAAPCNDFFGKNAAVLSVYFVALSYLCGSALHQMGIYLEKRLLPNEENVFATHCQQQAIEAAYRRQFLTSFPGDNNNGAQIQAGREIFHHVQSKGRPQRILIFSAFYAMSRTLLVTIPIVFAVIAASCTLTLELLPLCAVCIVAWIICFLRWKDFDRCCITEAYTIFAAEEAARAATDQDGPQPPPT